MTKLSLSQVTIVNNTNLYGFTSSNITGISNRSNTPSGVVLQVWNSPGIATAKLDTVLGLTGYDSLRFEVTAWSNVSSSSSMNASLNTVNIPTTPATYTFYSTNIASIAFTVVLNVYSSTYPKTAITLKDLKIYAYQSSTSISNELLNNPSIIYSSGKNIMTTLNTEKEYKINILGLDGRILSINKLDHINKTDLPAGIYIVNIITDKKIVLSKKLYLGD